MLLVLLWNKVNELCIVTIRLSCTRSWFVFLPRRPRVNIGRTSERGSETLGVLKRAQKTWKKYLKNDSEHEILFCFLLAKMIPNPRYTGYFDSNTVEQMFNISYVEPYLEWPCCEWIRYYLCITLQWMKTILPLKDTDGNEE